MNTPNVLPSFAIEAGHWYDRDGNARYEVPKAPIKAKCPTCTGAMRSAEQKATTAACTVCGPDGYVFTENPEKRATNLGDARKLDLCPSVTGIIRVMAAPGLERYKLMQFAQAAWTAPAEIKGMDFEPWLLAVDKDAKEHARQAAQKGTDIHATIEKGLMGEDLTSYLYADWYDAVVKACTEAWGTMPAFEPERSFTSVEWGFGCKADGICRSTNLVADFKTKDFKGEEPELQDDHLMQLAGNAVAAGMPNASGAIIFVDREFPKVVIRKATSEQMVRGWAMFQHCLALKQLVDGFRPSWATR